MRRWIVCGVALVTMSRAADAQALITGQVRDSAGNALVGAQVLLQGTSHEARTDSAGRYRISAEPETYSVLFRQLGYGPLTRRARLTRGGTTVVDAVLAVGDVPQLDTVEARAQRPRGFGRQGFQDRRTLGLGKFIDSTILRKSEARRLSEMLREYGVRMVSRDMHNRKYFAVHPTKGCYMTVYLDGVALYRSGARGEIPPDFAYELSIRSFEAIEIYRSLAELPMEFAGRDSECGVIALWTRRGGS